MNVKIIGVGKLKEKYLKDGIAEYAKRLQKFAKFEVIDWYDFTGKEYRQDTIALLCDGGNVAAKKLGADS